MSCNRHIGHVLLAIVLIVACAVSSVGQALALQGASFAAAHAGHGHDASGHAHAFPPAQVASEVADVVVTSIEVAPTDTNPDAGTSAHCGICPAHAVGLATPDAPVRFARMWQPLHPRLGMADLVPAGFIAEALPEPPRNLA